VIFEGTPSELVRDERSLTGIHLARRLAGAGVA
jgi:hypothetical protein